MVGEYDSNNLKNQFTFKVTFNNFLMKFIKLFAVVYASSNSGFSAS